MPLLSNKIYAKVYCRELSNFYVGLNIAVVDELLMDIFRLWPDPPVEYDRSAYMLLSQCRRNLSL